MSQIETRILNSFDCPSQSVCLSLRPSVLASLLCTVAHWQQTLIIAMNKEKQEQLDLFGQEIQLRGKKAFGSDESS